MRAQLAARFGLDPVDHVIEDGDLPVEIEDLQRLAVQAGSPGSARERCDEPSHSTSSRQIG